MAGRILIADKVATNRIALKAVAAGARHEALDAATPEDVLAAVREHGLALVILDGDLDTSVSPSLTSRIKSDPRTAALPVIVLTALSDTDARLRALRDGADETTAKPIDPALLMARMRSLLRAADTVAALTTREATVRDMGFAEPAPSFDHAGRVTVAARTRAAAETLAAGLGPHSALAVTACSLDEALASADETPPADLFLIEAEQNRAGDAMRLFSELRSRGRTRHSGIVIRHAGGDSATGILALDMGASDVVDARCGATELAMRLDIQLRRKRTGDRLRASVDEGLRLAVTDPLTGLFNRRYAYAHARRIAATGAESGPYCVILADIDHFKSVNDRFGHGAGDDVLVEVAARLRGDLRSGDMLARIGGEEFLIVMADTTPDIAETAARRLCDTVKNRPVPIRGGETAVAVTISLGVAMAEPGEDIDRLVARADGALYAAKACGRDRFRIAPGAAA